MKKFYSSVFILFILYSFSNIEVYGQKKVKQMVVFRTTNTHTLWDGVAVPIYAFASSPFVNSILPGVTIYATEGDTVEINAKNLSQGVPHTIHLHGLDVDTRNDGDPMTSFALNHQEDTTYTFVAAHAGTYLYHCHFMDVVHLQMGMYGLVVVKPKDVMTPFKGGPVFQKEYSWLMSELDKNWHDSLPKLPEHTSGIALPPYKPSYFLINGKSKQMLADPTIAIAANVGDKVYLRTANIGYYYNKIIFPKNIIPTVIDSDGRPLKKPYTNDTIEIVSGERYGILFSSDMVLKDNILIQYYDMNNHQLKGEEKVQVLFDENTNSIEEKNVYPIRISPNPVQNYCNIEYSDQSQWGKIMVYNTQGQLIKIFKLEQIATHHQLDFSEFRDGLYCVKFIDNEHSTQVNIVVRH